MSLVLMAHDVRLDILGGGLRRFLFDPDDPDFALDLAAHMTAPDDVRGLAEWVARRYPTLYDAHLVLAELARDAGDMALAQTHAARCLEALEEQGEAVDQVIRDEVQAEVRAILGG